MNTGPVARRDAERRGRRAETLCVWWLRLGGWRILSRRLTGRRGSGAGEIDIIARRGNVVTFIEVKARTATAEGLIAVSANQQRRIARAAEAYLAHHVELGTLQVRFDVMVVGGGLLPHHLVDAWRPL